MRDHGPHIDAQQRDTLAARKRLHDGLNRFISERGGWLTSIPGDPLMRFEALAAAALPDELRALGYVVSPAGSTTRINPHGSAEVIAAARSSMPPLRWVTHATIERVTIYEIALRTSPTS
jgi:hypothetical protein